MSTRTGGRTTVATLLWVLLPVALAGQDASPGDRVRIRQLDGTELTGTVQSVSDDDLRILTRTRADRLVPADRITSIERSVGQERRFAQNFFLSIVGGVGVGAVLGAATWSPCNETGFLACFLHPSSRSEAAGFGAAVGGVLGIPIGLVLGLSIKHDVWEPVTVPGRGGFALEVIPLLSTDRVGFTASIPVRGF